MIDPASFQQRLNHVAFVTGAVVLLLFGSLAYWQAFRVDLATSQYNPRVLTTYNDPGRGRILDRDGVVLAETGDGGTRTYSDTSMAHVLGYLSARYGSQGAELAFNDTLIGQEGRSWEAAFDAEFRRTATNGLDVQLTLDADVQAAAVAALGGRRGAAVALDPRNGDVLAMVSNPIYDPATVDERGEELFADESAPMLNRATQGLYPPGSTFKAVTATALLAHGIVSPDTTVTCEDEYVVEGFAISCSNVQQGVGTYPFSDAFAFSVNAIFAEMGVELGWPRLLAIAREWGFNESIPFVLDTAPNRVTNPDAERSGPLLASTAFGQGQLLVSPLQMALVAATIANDGEMRLPRIGLRAVEDGQDRGTLESPGSRRIMPADTAREVAAMMRAVVTEGQAAGVQFDGLPIAGKTGTAESGEGDETHAWFIAFGPYDDAEVAVAVLVERGGQGSQVAAPIAGQVIRAAVGQ